MTSKQAIKALEKAGYKIISKGKGDHILMRMETHVIIIPGGKSQLSHGMVGRVRSYLRK